MLCNVINGGEEITIIIIFDCIKLLILNSLKSAVLNN